MQKILLSALVFGSTFLSIQSASASCDVGPVLFRDSLYGAALGTGVGALLLLANQNSSNIGPTLATSALIGTASGLVVGVVEISLSECAAPMPRKKHYEQDASIFEIKPLVTFMDSTQIDAVTHRPVNSFSLKEIEGGLTLKFILN